MDPTSAKDSAIPTDSRVSLVPGQPRASPCHASLLTFAPLLEIRSDTTSRCAVDRKTHRERTLLISKRFKAACDCRPMDSYTRPRTIEAHEIWKAKSYQAEIQVAGVSKKTYLSKIHLNQPCTEGVRRLPAGSNMQTKRNPLVLLCMR